MELLGVDLSPTSIGRCNSGDLIAITIQRLTPWSKDKEISMCKYQPSKASCPKGKKSPTEKPKDIVKMIVRFETNILHR